MPEPRWQANPLSRTTRQIRADFEDELAFHYDMRVAELVATGLSRADAVSRAAREFGDIDDARRYVAAVDHAAESTIRRRDTMREIAQDVRHVFRRLRRAPVYATTAVASLALGIGACALMFNIVASVLMAPLPFKNADRIAMIWANLPQVDLGFPEQPIAGRYFVELRKNLREFASFAAFRAGPFNLAGASDSERLDGIQATGEFFDAIGVAPQLGRFFTPADEADPHGSVVVLSDDLWRARFAGDGGIVGRVISLNAQPYTVIGVAPAGFAFPRGLEMPGSFQFPARAQLWVPIAPPQRGPSDLAIVARLRDGSTFDRATADLDHVREIEERLIPQGKGWFGTMAVPLRTQLVGRSETMLFSLVGAVALLLLLACVNTGQLQLAQLQTRRRELAVRAALGAASSRIAREVVIELVLLVAVAGIIGGVASRLGLSAVRAYGAARLPRLAQATFDWRAVGVAVLAAAIAGLLASFIAGATAARVPLIETLRRGGRGTSGDSARTRRWLIATELALCVGLVASAGLLMRSLSRQLNSATGFAAPNGLTFEVTLPTTKYPEKQGPTFMEHPAAAAFLTTALENVRAVSGVQAAAIGKPLPLSGAQEATVFVAENAPPRRAGEPPPIAQYTIASPEMFNTLGTPMIAGRDFNDQDRLESPPVVIVNKSMADGLWPRESAVGKRIKLGGSLASPAPWMTVIGVSADIKRYTLTETPRPEMIVPYTQNPYPSFLTMQFVVRTRDDVTGLVPALRHAIASADPTVPVSAVRTIDDLLGQTSAPARFMTRFMTAFGAAALVLAMVGVYGVAAFSVHQRRQEFGVRRALGASRGEVLGLVLRQACGLAGAGTAAGLLLALAAGYALRHLLYQIAAVDVITLTATVGVLAVATVIASLAPAWRASRIEARVALDEA